MLHDGNNTLSLREGPWNPALNQLKSAGTVSQASQEILRLRAIADKPSNRSRHKRQ
jgi:hypothetical protein